MFPVPVVPNIKDINFWEQFTTVKARFLGTRSCSEYQRYQLLRAIHNSQTRSFFLLLLFRISKISTFESNSQLFPESAEQLSGCSEYQRYQLLRAIHNTVSHSSATCQVVPNIKDINFWEQFTTGWARIFHGSVLFRISKISTFESNSQLLVESVSDTPGCSEYQRYQLLRAIHNTQFHFQRKRRVVPNIKDINFWEQFTTGCIYSLFIYVLFRISKISTFESNSQQIWWTNYVNTGCSEYQRYQLLRAIHNSKWFYHFLKLVVPNIKDINFWEQFTTSCHV